jgi:hypothetical protein
MITLGMDPSITGFGWCVHDSNATGMARVIAKGCFSTSPDEVFVTRYMSLRESVGGLLDKHPEIEAVGVESPPFGETWSEGLYGLYLYVAEAIYLRRKDVVYFDPTTLKMLAKIDPDARRGKMFKIDMVNAAKADTDLKSRWNHNEADAYLLAKFAARFWAFYNGTITEDQLTPSEYHAFARTHTFKKGEKAGQTVKFGAVYKEDRRFFRFSQIPPRSKT